MNRIEGFGVAHRPRHEDRAFERGQNEHGQRTGARFVHTIAHESLLDHLAPSDERRASTVDDASCLFGLGGVTRFDDHCNDRAPRTEITVLQLLTVTRKEVIQRIER